MELTQTFSIGDRVSHPGKPEWGSGVVREVNPVTHEGKAAQRVRVDFVNKGSTVINTAIAPLVKGAANQNSTWRSPGDPKNPFKSDPQPLSNGLEKEKNMSTTDTTKHGAGWLDELDGGAQGTGNRNLWDLPFDVSDAFSSLEQKLDAAMETFKYSTEPGPLFQWAVAQTGEDDPLTKHTRVELEQAFSRYVRDRDNAVFDLVRQMKRANLRDLVRAKARACPYPAGKAILEKANR